MPHVHVAHAGMTHIYQGNRLVAHRNRFTEKNGNRLVAHRTYKPAHPSRICRACVVVPAERADMALHIYVLVARAFDTRDKGFVTFDDLKRVFTEANPDLSETEIADAFCEGDTIGQGRISYEQFISLFSSRCKECE